MKKFLTGVLISLTLIGAAPAAHARDIEVPMSTNTAQLITDSFQRMSTSPSEFVWGFFTVITAPILAYIEPQSTDTLRGDENFIYTSN